MRYVGLNDKRQAILNLEIRSRYRKHWWGRLYYGAVDTVRKLLSSFHRKFPHFSLLLESEGAVAIVRENERRRSAEVKPWIPTEEELIAIKREEEEAEKRLREISDKWEHEED